NRVRDGLPDALVGEVVDAAAAEGVHLDEPRAQDVGRLDAGAAADRRRLVGADGAGARDVDLAGHERGDPARLLGPGAEHGVADRRLALGAAEVLVAALEAARVALAAR